MKKIVYLLAFLLLAAPASLQAAKKQKLTKAEREAQRVEELRGLIESRSFDFNATAYETTYGGTRRYTARGDMALHPGWTDFNLPGAPVPDDSEGFKAERVSPGSYAVTETDEGWVVVFTAKAMGLNGDRLYDGVSVTFTFKLTIAYSGKAVLEVSTDFNQHKYPHIYRGTISRNKI